jgi:glutathione S-transferase
MEFTSDERVRAIRALMDALFEHVLYDEEPIFVGDEATILDVSVAPTAELQKRCSAYYKTAVSIEDLRRPLWQVLPELERRREAAD